MIQSTNVLCFLLDYEGPMDYEGPFLKLEAVIMKVHPLKSNAAIMKVPRIMKAPTYVCGGTVFMVLTVCANFDKLQF